MTDLPKLLYGEGAFVRVPHIFEGLSLEQVSARPTGAPHSIYEELWHTRFWQDFLLERARGGQPKAPEHAEGSWPQSGPEREADWQALVGAFMKGLDTARELARDPGRLEAKADESRTLRGVLENLAVHNAYHCGRVVLLRQLMGLWPPPSGGDSW
ncbi:MAG: DinB family protein [Deinococcota bacterium]|jgi:uncharacterized damage-inducible protein DinB|nr:DinB family protein [Deinococcota bacterium]